MFAIKRNQVIITALVVMIAVAGYLNYMDGRPNQTNQLMLNAEGEIIALIPDDVTAASGHLIMEIGDSFILDENPDIFTEYELRPEAGEAIFVSGSNISTYFAQARLEREQSRAKQKEILTAMINNVNLEEVKRAEVADEMLSISKRIEKETAAEAMIEAKGFKEVHVRIDDNTVDVIVNKEMLSEAEIAQIEDIVRRKTGMDTAQIRISTMKH